MQIKKKRDEGAGVTGSCSQRFYGQFCWQKEGLWPSRLIQTRQELASHLSPSQTGSPSELSHGTMGPILGPKKGKEAPIVSPIPEAVTNIPLNSREGMSQARLRTLLLTKLLLMIHHEECSSCHPIYQHIIWKSTWGTRSVAKPP